MRKINNAKCRIKIIGLLPFFIIERINTSRISGLSGIDITWPYCLRCCLSWGIEAGLNSLKLVRTTESVNFGPSPCRSLFIQYLGTNDSALYLCSSVSSPSSTWHFTGQYSCMRFQAKESSTTDMSCIFQRSTTCCHGGNFVTCLEQIGQGKQVR